MMSLIDLDDDQRWVPTHVNVTVLRARGLRTKGKHGSRYLYTIIQVGKEKYTTGLVEKAEVPMWNEECCFELLPGILEDSGRSAYPPGSGDLVLTVMHRVLIGLDVFLGQTIIPLDKIFQDGVCPREEWFKLSSKVGRKEKERGELEVTVQFTRNNMTASMFDLTMKDKPRSAFGKLKDRVTGRKRGDVESSSAIVPGRYAALSGSLGQPFGEEGGGVPESRDGQITEEKRSKMKDFFKGRLRKSSDTRSCSSLASESSLSSMASDNLGPPPSLDLLSDPPSSPIYTSKVRVDPHYGETDLAKKVLTSQHTTKILTHKRAFSDEASKITTAMTQSKSSLCINGSHVYDSEPSTPKSSAALPSKLVLLEKCSPLSRSLQNLTKRSEDKGSFSEGRRWSFDKVKKEEKDEDKEAQASSASAQEAQTGDRSVQGAMPMVSSASSSPDKGRKLRKTLFSTGRSDSLPAKSDLSQAGSASEGKFRGWFGSGDSQNKPRLNSPKHPPEQPRTSPTLSCKHSYLPVDDIICYYAQELQTCKDEPPPLPPRRLLRTPVNEIFSDGWLHRGQELAVHKEAYLLSQTGVASLQHGREAECKRNSISPDVHTSSETSDSLNVHTQPRTKNTSLGFTSEERHKKFKYEPLEDETDFWGGMLFEQDLYGRVCRRSYEQQKVKSYHLSLNAEDIAENKLASNFSGCEKRLDSDVAVSNLLCVPSSIPSKVPDISYTPAEEMEEANLCETSCINNNISFSLTLGDLNMNVNNSDFSFIDSDGSSQSDVADAVKSFDSLGGTHPNEDSMTVSHNKETKLEDMFTLKDTYIPALNSSFEIAVSSKKLCKVPPVCPDNCQDCGCERDNVAPNSHCKAALTSNNPASNTAEVKTECKEEQKGDNNDFKKSKDYNGNPQDQAKLFSGVVSARIRPKGMSRQNSSGSPNNQSRNGDRDFEQFLSLVQNFSEISEGPSSYQPTKSVMSSLQALEQADTLKVSSTDDQTHQYEADASQTASHVAEKNSFLSFKDLHAKVAPNSKTPSKAKIGTSLLDPDSCSSPIPSVLSLSADTPAHCLLIQTSVMGSSGGATSTLAETSYTSSTTFSTDQPLVDARHSLLPEETQPASSLPLQESRPHPVKPLTSSQSDKKESRSVLEKLKSTINPGRAAHQAPAEPEKSQEVSVDRAAQYQHLTNMELISLLLQQEMDMQKQQVASEQQGLQLGKCEAELKKVKSQVRDLEDYIDNLLLRIIEQTPTLLQVRSRHK
uniref:RAB11 family interacting protein 5 (Class I) n=1 Tax=Iconisemion striatum TaxID=60296 RepID=A0A1A7XAJ2_9TELE